MRTLRPGVTSEISREILALIQVVNLRVLMSQDMVVFRVSLILQIVVCVVWTSHQKLRVCSIERVPGYLEHSP